MLVSLRIQNMAIIDSVFLEFHSGFNVLTGETGAGKSIILGALDLLLGGRASTDVVRANCERAEVEGLFEVDDGLPRAALKELDLMEEEASTLLIRRVVSKGGRSRVTVNGRQVTASMLRTLTKHLLDMSSQHAHYALLSTEEHMHLLDQFGRCERQQKQYVKVYQRLLELRGRLRHLEEAERLRLEREDFIRFQLKEIDNIEPQPGEDDELEAELKVSRNGAFLRSGAEKASNQLSGTGGAACNQLHGVIRTLETLVERDETLEPLLERVSSARIDLEDLAFELARYASGISSSPGELDRQENRLADLRKLKRKYGATLDAVLERREDLATEVAEFESLESSLEKIKKDLEATEHEAEDLARKWSSMRLKAGKKMAKAIESELKALALPKCRFSVEVSLLEDESGHLSLSEGGADRVCFLIAPNPGEGFKELNKVASGGELSRILLAIKSALVQTDPVETSIYDEVDSGIGGSTAEQVGRKLKTSAKKRQVIAISHHAQTVAFGDRHFLVVKSEQDGRTTTEVRLLSERERAEEMARMLGGVNLTPQSRAHAQEMLDSSLAWTPQA